MGQTHRKNDTFGAKKRIRDRKKLLKRMKKQKKRQYKQPDLDIRFEEEFE